MTTTPLLTAAETDRFWTRARKAAWSDPLGRRTMHLAVMTQSYTWNEYEELAFCHPTTATLATSLLPDGRHAPVLDLDIPHRLVSSSTPGHSHLFLDVPMSWRSYKKLLKALAKAGIIEPGYRDASLRRGHTAVQMPWVKKAAPQA